MHSKIITNQQKKKRSNVQIHSVFSSRIATFGDAASWYGFFLEQQYNEISKPEVIRFRVFSCDYFNLNISPKSNFLGAISRFPLYLFSSTLFSSHRKKKDAAAKRGTSFDDSNKTIKNLSQSGLKITLCHSESSKAD